jgi:hypothetical protein
MPLISCPECGRQISTEAESCPQCGHPNYKRPQRVDGPACYACSAAATTRCQRCGALSCAEHLQNIFVNHGRGGSYELRCESCYSSAMAWKSVSIVIAIVILAIVALAFLSRM